MKRLITILISLTLAISLMGQSKNWYRHTMKFHGGVKIGNTVESTGVNKTGSLLIEMDSVTGDNATAPTLFKVYNGSTQLNPDIPTAFQIDNATVFTKLAPDTVQHTTNYTVAASDWGKDQHLNKATSILITLPPNLTDWPIGGVMNFYSFGAGISVFHAGSGVVFVADTASTVLCATARGKQDVSVKKIAASKYKLTGPLSD